MKRAELKLDSCPIAGTNLIEASAGTGKTYTISGLFLRMIIEKQLMVNEILVVTFTRAATEELKDRIYKLLISARNAFSGHPCDDPFLQSLLSDFSESDSNAEALKRIKDAIRDFDECAIFTIHGFCQRMLVENAFESRSLYDTEVVMDQSEFILDAVQDFWRTRFYDAPMFLISEFINIGINGLVNLFRYRERNPELRIQQVPHVPEAADVLVALEQCEAARAKVREILPESSAALLLLFEMDQKLLNGQAYNKNLPIYCDAVWAYIRSNKPIEFLDLPDKIDIFCPSVMRTKLLKSNKDQRIPASPVFPLIEMFVDVYQSFETLKIALVTQTKVDLFHVVEMRLQERKRSENTQSFNDFLVNLKTSLLTSDDQSLLSESVRKRFKAAMIDEFQDTDPVQYAIFNELFADDRILFLIGDPKQAIYSFRGADIYAYLSASNDVNRVYTLPNNYRSDADLVSGVNRVFSLSDRPFIDEQIQFDAVTAVQSGPSDLVVEGEFSSGLTIWTGPPRDEKDVYSSPTASVAVCEAVTAEIYRLLKMATERKAYINKNGKQEVLKPSDFAILVRKKSEMKLLEQYLTRYGIPCVLSGTSSVFDTPEAFDLRRFLLAVLNPKDSRAVKAAMAGSGFGATAVDLDAVNRGASDLLEFFVASLKSYNESHHQNGFIHMFRQYLADYQVKERLIALPNGERKLTNLLHLSEILHEKYVSSGGGLLELFKWFCQQMDAPELRKEETELRMETDENAVTVVTIHKSKGLEYPFVFAPFVWSHVDEQETLFHDGEGMVLDLGNDVEEASKQKAFKDMMSEKMRLYYVAMTRAKYRCYTFWGGFNSRGSAHLSAPAYLFHGSTVSKDNLAADLKAVFKGLKHADVEKHLAALFELDPTVRVSNLPVISFDEPLMLDVATTEFKIISAERHITDGSRVSSFSGLTRHTAVHTKDMDKLLADVVTVEPAKPNSIFDLPKGARIGTFLHEFFEHLHFQSATDDRSLNLLSLLLQKYNVDDRFRDAVWQMKEDVLSAILPGHILLNQLSDDHRLNEMEFHFSMSKFHLSKLRELAKEYNLPDMYVERLKRLNTTVTQGFMTGFIDMVFEHEGKYYLLDWKSNHLGNQLNDYHQGALMGAMAEHDYFLQYWIYSVALHQYLAQVIPDYDYDTQFGGAFYLFIRGVSADTGVYFNKLERNFVLALTELFS